MDKINASRKLAVVITPYPSKDPVQNTNIALYKAAIDAVVSEDAKIVDFSSIAVSNINDDGTLTLEGCKPSEKRTWLRKHYNFLQFSPEKPRTRLLPHRKEGKC